VENKDKNKILEQAVEQFALILVVLIDEVHTQKKEGSKPSSRDIKNSH